MWEDIFEGCLYENVKSRPIGGAGRANLTAKDLAISVLRMASKNAMGMIYELKVLMENDRLGPQVHQGLSDCTDMLMDAGDQIVALSALSSDETFDTHKWLQVVTDAADLCKASLEGIEQVMLAKADALITVDGLCLSTFSSSSRIVPLD